MAALIALTDSQISQGKSTETAIFAGGCFWCMQPPYAKQAGVESVTVGYTGGTGHAKPTYEQVSGGKTGHFEAVEIVFDPSRISYKQLLDIFWHNIDPTDNLGQFADKGSQYRTAIFYTTAQQKLLAEESVAALGASGKFKKPIATKIIAAGEFFPAEEYHQEYYLKNTVQYNNYKRYSGREAYVHTTWPDTDATPSYPQISLKLSREELKKKLTPIQYDVAVCSATEPPFHNAYWDNKREGIYVDIVSGEPLFASFDKFESGTGWPSFTRALDSGNVVEKTDNSHGMIRTEVRSKQGDSHLGHLFHDGPLPGGERYCINSASLRFVPRKDLQKESLGRYEYLFDKKGK